jgi:uncharacterized membrane protein
MFSKTFWFDVIERAFKTMAQVGIVVVSAAGPFNLFTLDAKNFLGIVGGAAFLSVLTSIASAPFGVKGTASVLEAKPPVQ